MKCKCKGEARGQWSLHMHVIRVKESVPFLNVFTAGVLDAFLLSLQSK